MHGVIVFALEIVMRRIVATITGRGQITLPSAVRRRLGAKTGDKLEFVIDEERDEIRLSIPSYPDIASLRGAAGSLSEPLPWMEVLRIGREDGGAAKSQQQP